MEAETLWGRPRDIRRVREVFRRGVKSVSGREPLSPSSGTRSSLTRPVEHRVSGTRRHCPSFAASALHVLVLARSVVLNDASQVHEETSV